MKGAVRDGDRVGPETDRQDQEHQDAGPHPRVQPAGPQPVLGGAGPAAVRGRARPGRPHRARRRRRQPSSSSTAPSTPTPSPARSSASSAGTTAGSAPPGHLMMPTATVTFASPDAGPTTDVDVYTDGSGANPGTIVKGGALYDTGGLYENDGNWEPHLSILGDYQGLLYDRTFTGGNFDVTAEISFATGSSHVGIWMARTARQRQPAEPHRLHGPDLGQPRPGLPHRLQRGRPTRRPNILRQPLHPDRDAHGSDCRHVHHRPDQGHPRRPRRRCAPRVLPVDEPAAHPPGQCCGPAILRAPPGTGSGTSGSPRKYRTSRWCGKPSATLSRSMFATAGTPEQPTGGPDRPPRRVGCRAVVGGHRHVMPGRRRPRRRHLSPLRRHGHRPHHRLGRHRRPGRADHHRRGVGPDGKPDHRQHGLPAGDGRGPRRPGRHRRRGSR